MNNNNGKSGCFSNFLLIIIIIIIIFNYFGKVNNSQTSDESINTSIDESINTSIDESSNIPFDESERITVDIDTLFEDLDNNAMVAEEKYNNARIKLTGKIKSFDSDGKYFSIGSPDNSYMFSSILCDITEDQKSELMKFSKGDLITLKGTITSIGEIIGYSLDVEEILP